MPPDPIAMLAVLAPLLAGAFAGSMLAVGAWLSTPGPDYSDEEKAAFRRAWEDYAERVPHHRLALPPGDPHEPLRLVAACLDGREVVAICAELVLRPVGWKLRVFPDRFPEATRELAIRYPLPLRRPGGRLSSSQGIVEGDLEPEALDADRVFEVLFGALLASSARRPGLGPASHSAEGIPVALPL